MTTRIVLVIMGLVVVAMMPVVCLADSAAVLPKGVFSLDSTYYHYLDIKKRYNPDGEAEDLAADYNADLNSTVFPALAALGAGATLGRSVVDSTLSYRWSEFWLAYGLTDKATIAAMIPVNSSKNSVNASLDTSVATVGKSAIGTTFVGGGCPCPLVPLAGGGPFGDAVPLTTDDIQNLLGAGLDTDGNSSIDIPGYGYQRVQTWSESGIGDVELIGKYRFYAADDWRSAVVLGIRLPTGAVEDPDNLMDVPFGDGQTDLLFRLSQDYLGIQKVLLNMTFRYDLQLPDHETKRVPSDVNLPLTLNKEQVDRDLGDMVELELMGNYAWTKQWSLGVKYRYSQKFKDEVNGNQGFAYSSLENETDFTSHMGFVTIGYSTVQMYLEKTFPVPFSANISYRNRFAGTNNVTKSEFLSANLSLYF